MLTSARAHWLAGTLVTLATLAAGPAALGQPKVPELPQPRRDPESKPPQIKPPPLAASILAPEVKLIDLGSALRLAGVSNPEILLARERVNEAMALHLLAAVQLLPTINAGTNVDAHNGPLQTSSGTILRVNRDALYAGLGANAVAAGSVNIPGLVISGNVSNGLFTALATRQVVRARRFDSVAVRNSVLLRVATGYVDLLSAEGRRAIALKTRDDAHEVARVTADYSNTGQGRFADAERAASSLDQRNAEVLQAENDVLDASARLCQLLGLDPSIRLHAIDGWVVPATIVPDSRPLAELIAIALQQRPELAAQRAEIQAALYRLSQANFLPFAPNLILGYSAGTFGGGSNLVSQGLPQANGSILRQPRFGSFNDRQDVDAVIYWSLQNLGVGNVALSRLARSNVRISNYRLLEIVNQVRTEVATAYAQSHARFAQIEIGERAVRTSTNAFKQDLFRTRNKEGLPIEVLDSLRLLGRSRDTYLAAILEYDRAQFELYVALGQPPAQYLAQPIPEKLVPAPKVPPGDPHSQALFGNGGAQPFCSPAPVNQGGQANGRMVPSH